MFKQRKAQTPAPEEALPTDPRLGEDPGPSSVTEKEALPPDSQFGEAPGPDIVTEEKALPLDSQFGEAQGISTVAEVAALEPVATAQMDIDAVRELILGLHPSIVPELIGGDSVASLIASIAPAQKAYANIVSNRHIPAGGNPIIESDDDSLTTDEKIRRGLTAYQRKG